MVPKHFKNYQEAMAKTLATHDEYKNDILYEYSFNDYYKEVKLNGLISEIFMPKYKLDYDQFKMLNFWISYRRRTH